MLKSKTTIAILLTVFLIIMLLCTGCNSKKYVAVAQVEFTTSGELIKKTSTKRAMYKFNQSITADEYWSVPYENHITNQSMEKIDLKANYVIPKEERGKTQFVVKPTKTTSMYYQSYSFTGAPLYSEYKYEGTEYLIVYVKVINNTTIIVKDNYGETIYNVSSYRITEFRG